MRCIGFEPFVPEGSRLLILGSFPSVKSREQQFYYGHPQNRFWRIVAEALGEEMPRSVCDKKALLSRHKIALWDMVTECDIEGSLDCNIKDYKVADVRALVQGHSITGIITNGGKAAELFKRYCPELTDMAEFLPSTSPANARFDNEQWLNAIRKAAK